MVKRLIGGLVLLNLTSISLGLTSGEVDITDVGVLEQLKELRTFIDDKRNFSKESKELKPVLVQYRSSASKIDGVVQCNMQFNTDALHLNICGTSIQKDGTPITITINVVYEYTDYVGYTIKTAKLNATQNQPIFETIVDKNGNKRFIEGDLDTETIEGIEFTYAKWSLSGSHLMIVLAGDVASGTTISQQNLCEIDLPDFIKDKIVVLFSSVVSLNETKAFDGSWNSQDIYSYLYKTNEGIGIYVYSTTEFATNKSFRIQFDLLIDNEDEE